MRKVTVNILIALFVAVLALFFLRAFNEREVDDLHPDISCDDSLIKKSDVLWVIPLYNNNSISNNSEWIETVKSYNKTLGIHGIDHSYRELDSDRDKEYFDWGINEFEKAFGKTSIFKPSHLAINQNNKKYMESRGFRVYGEWHQITHKVYHCSDTGMFPNWMIDLF